MFRTGPGPVRFASRSAALRSASAARSRAFSTWAAASLTRQCSLAGCRGGFRSGLPARASDAALRACQSSIFACCAAVTRARFSSASSTAAESGDRPVRSPASCRARNASAFAACSACAASRSASRSASAARIRPARDRGDHAASGTSSPRNPSPNSASSAASAAACAATASSASFRSPSSVRFAAFDAFAAIFIPSSATVPSRPIPSRAHKISTSVKNAAVASGKSDRNRANVE